MSPHTPLWSDGWDHDPTPPPAQDVPAAAGPPPAAGPPAARLLPAAAAVFVVAAAAAGLSSRAGQRDIPAVAVPQHAASASAAAAPPSVPATPRPHRGNARGDALGLQLAGAPGRRVIVAGVVPGSPVTAVGVDAGEVLRTVNGQPVHSPAEAEAILHRLPLGSPVSLVLTDGATQITAQLQEPGIP